MSEKVDTTLTQYLTFVLGDEIFALDIASVREVLELTSITKVPRTPEYMRGVINLRGHAVPVVDMRLKFGMSKVKDTVDTCIIIVEVEMEGENAVMGALVDSVREVFEMYADQIEQPPRMGLSVNTDFLRGMGKQDDDFVMILDINRVFSADELVAIGAEKAKEHAAQEEAA